MEARVAVLEEIAKATKDTLARLEAGQERLRTEMQALRSDVTAELRAVRADMTAELRAVRVDMAAELRAVRTEQRADFRWLLGIMLGMGAGLFTLGLGLLGAMAKGFRWL